MFVKDKKIQLPAENVNTIGSINYAINHINYLHDFVILLLKKFSGGRLVGQDGEEIYDLHDQWCNYAEDSTNIAVWKLEAIEKNAFFEEIKCDGCLKYFLEVTCFIDLKTQNKIRLCDKCIISGKLK